MDAELAVRGRINEQKLRSVSLQLFTQRSQTQQQMCKRLTEQEMNNGAGMIHLKSKPKPTTSMPTLTWRGGRNILPVTPTAGE